MSRPFDHDNKDVDSFLQELELLEQEERAKAQPDPPEPEEVEESSSGGFIRLKDFIEKQKKAKLLFSQSAEPHTIKWKAIRAYQKQKKII